MNDLAQIGEVPSLRPEDLTDRPDVGAALRDLVRTAAPPSREDGLAIFRRQLARLQQHVQTRFERGGLSGLVAARLLSGLMDDFLAELFRYACALHPPEPQDRIGLAATGGYGRATLAPFSDIDLLFLTPAAPSARVREIVEFMLYFLWDLGLKVGHATRSTGECLSEARRDVTIRTSLLDARCLAGDRALFARFQTEFREDCREEGPAEYIAAKQAERATRHARFGDTPFMV